MQFPHGNFVEFSGGLFWWNKIFTTIHLALALPPQLSPKQNIARSSKTRQLHFYCPPTWTMKVWETRHSGLYLGTWKLGCEVCCLLPRLSPSRRGTWRCVGLVVLLQDLNHKIQVLTQILFHENVGRCFSPSELESSSLGRMCCWISSLASWQQTA